MALVSVIIPTHDRSSLLREAIESVLAVRREGFEVEIIVSDDGSTDETPAVAHDYPVRYLRAERAAGAAAARNAALAVARGDFIAFLDDDDLWLPQNITPQLRAFAEHPEYGAVHGQVLLTDERRVPYGKVETAAGASSGWLFDELLRYWPQLGSVVVRASVARAVGGFDPDLRSEEEWDWLLRIARSYPIGRVAETVVLFRQRGSGEDADLLWRRMPATLAVFRRQTRAVSPAQRLRYARVLWAHRGWYATEFLRCARQQARQGARGQAIRSVGYALRASLPHTAAALARPRRAGSAS
ncbi:MAG: glycosyltransferase family 2 protein [Ktedonobacterales bacterium]|nr:glycosyltransferase family 2 protein [Ktedonobacterales bacterium]